MNPIVVLLDFGVLCLGAWLLVNSVRIHGMHATVHLVRLITCVMGLFTAVQARWEDMFDAFMGRAALLNDFTDTRNSIALMMLFYIMSMVLLFIYDQYQRRNVSVATAESAPDAPLPE